MDAAAAAEAKEASQAQYLRLNADFENFRKRAAAEKEAVVVRTKAKVIEVRPLSPPWPRHGCIEITSAHGVHD